MTDLVAALGQALDAAKDREFEHAWRSLSDDQRWELVDGAKQKRPRTVAVFGYFKSYQSWLRSTRVKALSGDSVAFLLLTKEFFCSSPERLMGMTLENVVEVHGPNRSVAWKQQVATAVESAKIRGVWRGR